MDNSLHLMNGRLNRIDELFGRLDGQLYRVDERFDQMSEHLDRVDERLEADQVLQSTAITHTDLLLEPRMTRTRWEIMGPANQSRLLPSA